MTQYAKKYAKHTKTKHLFYGFKHLSAICGVTIQWCDPLPWQTDKEGLEKRTLCKRCEKIQEK